MVLKGGVKTYLRFKKLGDWLTLNFLISGRDTLGGKGGHRGYNRGVKKKGGNIFLTHIRRF